MGKERREFQSRRRGSRKGKVGEKLILEARATVVAPDRAVERRDGAFERRWSGGFL